MVYRVEVYLLVVFAPQPQSLQRLFAGSGGRHRQVENPTNGRRLNSSKSSVPSIYYVSGDPPLAICRPRKGDQGPPARDDVPDLDGIPHRPNPGIAGNHPVIDPYAAQFSDFQPGVPGKFCLRPHADSKNDDIGPYLFSGSKSGAQTALRHRFEPDNRHLPGAGKLRAA